VSALSSRQRLPTQHRYRYDRNREQTLSHVLPLQGVVSLAFHLPDFVSANLSEVSVQKRPDCC
jgi:hypothetical protein